jgi:3-deoxy-7-phosphoheptulonate synthase
MTGKNVTECTGGARALTADDLREDRPDRARCLLGGLDPGMLVLLALALDEVGGQERKQHEHPRIEAAE